MSSLAEPVAAAEPTEAVDVVSDIPAEEPTTEPVESSSEPEEVNQSETDTGKPQEEAEGVPGEGKPEAEPEKAPEVDAEIAKWLKAKNIDSKRYLEDPLVRSMADSYRNSEAFAMSQANKLNELKKAETIQAAETVHQATPTEPEQLTPTQELEKRYSDAALNMAHLMGFQSAEEAAQALVNAGLPNAFASLQNGYNAQYREALRQELLGSVQAEKEAQAKKEAQQKLETEYGSVKRAALDNLKSYRDKNKAFDVAFQKSGAAKVMSELAKTFKAPVEYLYAQKQWVDFMAKASEAITKVSDPSFGSKKDFEKSLKESKKGEMPGSQSLPDDHDAPIFKNIGRGTTLK